MDSEITYAEIRFPQKPKNFKTGQGPSIRTTGITPAPRSLQIPLLRVLGVSCVLLIIVTTALTAHAMLSSRHLHQRSLEAELCSSNLSFLGQVLSNFSAQANDSDTSLLLCSYRNDNQSKELSLSWQKAAEQQREISGLREKLEEVTKTYSYFLGEILKLDEAQCQREEDQEMSLFSGIRCLNCPRGWSREGGSCYFFSTVEETWERSRVKCEEMGAKLVVINDSNEQIFITERILEKTHWLGCSDTNSEGSWKWVDGSEVILKFWETKQPDNWSNNEDCGTINSKRQGMQNWNDVHCEWQLRYICERIKDQIVFKTSQPFAM
ncbi:hypothetical protein FKM82_014847 [Ascaphus truei]